MSIKFISNCSITSQQIIHSFLLLITLARINRFLFPFCPFAFVSRNWTTDQQKTVAIFSSFQCQLFPSQFVGQIKGQNGVNKRRRKPNDNNEFSQEEALANS
ncbi:hypothetical protein niasHT_035263 [Heterodera trifolii]|uniref:Uncharacterized protein n=1 Tax=Heterodera trifolii TaxID=157864 RepID=A0ABD2IXL8_9BILA